ncbi:hypothetical protein PIIN_05691 [Serendipita indica DSM 11827]|uniref:DUF6535 domain-containing protein n=1 Tax=Serendipita indica (strain DSM 11827) TaxID=1109443 RepID=G4TKA4_SERID|nr:hypothetical protein PIIN_05691 [Serendipita indica DSM 11827]
MGIPQRHRELPPTAIDGGAEKTAWEIYNERANIVDRELIRDWNESLNTLLIFAALYSAILTAFIIESMKLLEEDMQESTRDILLTISQQLANSTTGPFGRSKFEPEAWAIRVNYYFFTSISCSLIAALGAVLALQWVGSYDIGLTRPSPKLRAIQRQLRFNGAEKWKLGQIISILPLLIFASLFLLFIGLVEWLWHIHRKIAWVVIAGIVVAGLFYIVSHIISMLDVSAPFRTPISRSLPFAILRGYSWISLGVRRLFHWVQEKNRPPNRRVGSSIPQFRRTMMQAKAKLQKWPAKLSRIPAKLWKAISNPPTAYPFEQQERQILESHTYIQRDSILWLARNIDDVPVSRPHFLALLKEAITLPVEQLMAPEMDAAPWTAIFRNVFNDYDPEVLRSETPPEELKSLLEAALLIGSHSHLPLDLPLLQHPISELGQGNLSTWVLLTVWRQFAYYYGTPSDTLQHPLAQLVLTNSVSIRDLSDQMVYMILHRTRHQKRSSANGFPMLVDIWWVQRLIHPLMSPQPSDNQRRLSATALELLMAISVAAHKLSSDEFSKPDTFYKTSTTTWNQYCETLISEPGDPYREMMLTYHSVIILQWIEHARSSVDAEQRALYLTKRVAEVRTSVLNSVRPNILKFLQDAAWDRHTLQLIGSVISSTIQPYSASPADWWIEVITQCDQLLAEEIQSQDCVVSLLMRAAEATEYAIQSHAQASPPPIVHSGLLILASVILPNQYSLEPLKCMTISEVCECEYWPKLLRKWCENYERPSSGDIQSECIVLSEIAKISKRRILETEGWEQTREDLITEYIERRDDKAAYWESILADHLQGLLSTSDFDCVSMLCRIQDVPTFPDQFFEVGGQEWVINRLNGKQSHSEFPNLVAWCIKQSSSIRTLRSSMELAAIFLELMETDNDEAVADLLQQIPRALKVILNASTNGSQLLTSYYSVGMRSMAIQGWPNDVRAEMERLIKAYNRGYLISSPAEGHVRLVRDPDSHCTRGY